VQVDDWDVVDDTDKLVSRMVAGSTGCQRRAAQPNGYNNDVFAGPSIVQAWTDGEKGKRSTRDILIGDSSQAISAKDTERPARREETNRAVNGCGTKRERGRGRT
jgi:hypothetical protein